MFYCSGPYRTPPFVIYRYMISILSIQCFPQGYEALVDRERMHGVSVCDSISVRKPGGQRYEIIMGPHSKTIHITRGHRQMRENFT